ncbi:MAG TPA: 1-deoxy-D-xylulose-5-phosphate reductoisomerase, partial [Clostridiales bacterium]|nr:1-deoxy-D-xylulose-5-phosphate reductoisomerase [Clostridiales bacterium]
MNKGLEVIEAKWLFSLNPDQIQVLVHPQSIVHSLVEYRDGCVLAQMGIPDMRLPIQLALTWPERLPGNWPALDLMRAGSLTFEEPDRERFPSLKLAYRAMESGGSLPVVMNAANEIAVDAFLAEKIGFMDIPAVVEEAMDRAEFLKHPQTGDILELDQKARARARESCSRLGRPARNCPDNNTANSEGGTQQ